jgi:hypothetical protein
MQIEALNYKIELWDKPRRRNPYISRSDKLPDLVESSRDLPLGAIVIFGAPEAGKTSLAASASHFYPAEVPHKGEPIELSDCMWISYDDGATEALKDLGLYSPAMRWSKVFSHFEDPNKEPDLKTAASWRKSQTYMMARVRERKPKFVIHDTMSTMNGLLEAFHRERLNTLHAGNTQRMYGAISVENQLMAGAWGRLEADGIQNIYLFHGQAETADLIDASAKGGMEALQKAQRQTKADGEIGKADIILKAVGKARDMYVENVSYVFNLRKTVDEKTKKDVRVLHSRANAGILGKSRGINRLPAEIPNPNLGKIFALLGA